MGGGLIVRRIGFECGRLSARRTAFAGQLALTGALTLLLGWPADSAAAAAPIHDSSPSLQAEEDTRPVSWREKFECRRKYESAGDLFGSEASFDLYNGLLFIGAGGATTLAGDTGSNWTRDNGFDDGIRSGLRLDSIGARRDADFASNLTLGLGLAILPASGIAAKHWQTQDCIETWDMLTDGIESIGLTLFLTEVIKHASGRERPFRESCAPGHAAPRDADCGSDDRRRSFVSGHSSLAAAGAGLTCSFAVHRKAWGTSRTAQVVPCALGAVTALATGVLRISADRHWSSDVLAGFAIGAVVGYLDTWGPFDLLKFRVRNDKGHVAARGMILPLAQEGRFGAQLHMRF
jgi:membrane-associated phospholipid phosphatase